VVLVYPEFVGPTPLVGTQAIANTFAFVFKNLGNGGEHHIFSTPIISSGRGDESTVNITMRGFTTAKNYLTNQTFTFLDKKTHSFERRQGNWKISVLDFTLITQYVQNVLPPWIQPRF
jgi:hypothetical protein